MSVATQVDLCAKPNESFSYTLQLPKRVLNITAISEAASAEITTSSPHCLAVNDMVTLRGINVCPGVDGVYTVSAINGTDDNKFTVNLDSQTHGQTIAGGEVLVHNDLSSRTFGAAIYNRKTVTSTQRLTQASVLQTFATDTTCYLSADAPLSNILQAGDLFSSNTVGMSDVEILAVSTFEPKGDNEFLPDRYEQHVLLASNPPQTLSATSWYATRITTSKENRPDTLNSPINITKNNSALELDFPGVAEEIYWYQIYEQVGADKVFLQEGMLSVDPTFSPSDNSELTIVGLNGIVVPVPVTVPADAIDIIHTINTVTDMSALSVTGIANGYMIQPRGYSAIHDRPMPVYILEAAGGRTANGGTWVAASDGRLWVAQHGDRVYLDWFGVVLDGVTDDRLRVLEWAKYCMEQDFVAATFGTGECFVSAVIDLTPYAESGATYVFECGTGLVWKARELFSNRPGAATIVDATQTTLRGLTDYHMADTSNLNEGDIVRIDTKIGSTAGSVTFYQAVRVDAIISGTEFRGDAAYFHVGAGVAGHALPDGTTLHSQFVYYQPNANWIFRGFEIEARLTEITDDPDNFYTVIEIFGARQVLIEHCRIFPSRSVVGREETATGYFNLPQLMVAFMCDRVTARNIDLIATGYGIWVLWSRMAVLEKMTGRYCRHMYTVNFAMNSQIRDCWCYNGGPLDAHGAWEYYVENCQSLDETSVTGGLYSNIRAQGNISVKDSRFVTRIDGEVMTLGIVANVFLTQTWVNATNYPEWQALRRNQRITVSDVWVNGVLSLDASQHFTSSIKNCTARGLQWQEGAVVGYTLPDRHQTRIENLKFDNTGLPIQYPYVNGSNNRFTDYFSDGKVTPIFVAAASSGSGNDTWIVPLDSIESSAGIYGYNFLFNRDSGPGNFIAENETITLCFTHDSFAGRVLPGTTITLEVLGVIRHANAKVIDNNIAFTDQCIIQQSSATDGEIAQNFSYQGGSPLATLLTITAIRNHNAGLETLPTDWPSEIRRLEVDIRFNINQASGSCSLQFKGHVHKWQV